MFAGVAFIKRWMPLTGMGWVEPAPVGKCFEGGQRCFVRAMKFSDSYQESEHSNNGVGIVWELIEIQAKNEILGRA